eukprot:scaffold1813_cov134-Skeletonema_dohrnii-CCMP3373.AAC.4
MSSNYCPQYAMADEDDEGRLVVVVEKKNALQDDVDAASRMAEAPKDFIMVAAGLLAAEIFTVCKLHDVMADGGRID